MALQETIGKNSMVKDWWVGEEWETEGEPGRV